MYNILPENISEWFLQRNHSDYPVYLVGGAIRDQLQEIECRDYDFVIQAGAIGLARRLADDFHLPFYIMDQDRGIARVLMTIKGKDVTLDFADFRGESLVHDLQHRDFSINAMAREILVPDKIIDPLQGEADLKSCVLRACTPESFREDPVRCLRAVRFSNQLGFEMEEKTLSNLRIAVGELSRSSAERKRDELFNILSLQHPERAIQDLLDFGILENLLPELIPLVDFPQTAHHAHDAWLHTLAVFEYCRQILDWINSPVEIIPLNEFLLHAFQKLKPYRNYLKEYFNDSSFMHRTLWALFLFAALYHDVGKPSTRSQTPEGVQFINHDHIGARMAASRARELALSRREVGFVEAVIRHHMLIHSLVKQKNMNLRGTAFQYFQAAGHAGVADCLFSLADLLSTYEDKIEPERWEAGVKMSCNLLEMWVNHYKQVIDPDLLLDGDEIKQDFKIQEGPLVGELLNGLKKAQAIGEVNSRPEAIDFIKAAINRKSKVK